MRRNADTYGQDADTRRPDAEIRGRLGDEYEGAYEYDPYGREATVWVLGCFCLISTSLSLFCHKTVLLLSLRITIFDTIWNNPLDIIQYFDRITVLCYRD
jgi:hypothetical protein